MNNSVESSIDISSKKNHKKAIKVTIIIVVALLILSIVGLFIYKENVLLDKKNVIRNSVIKVFNSLENGVDNINSNILPINANEETVNIDGTTKLSSNYKDEEIDLSKLGSYDFKYNTTVDLKNNKLSGIINLNKDNNVLISLNTFINGKHGLVESKQLSYYAYNYNIGRDIKEIKIDNTNIYSNIKKIISRTRDITLNKIDENDITKDSVEDTIASSKSKFTRFTYKVNVNDYINNVLKFYITDTSVLNTIAELFNTDSASMKRTIQNIIDSNKDSETIKFEIYLDSLFGTFKQVKIYNEKEPNKYFRLYQVNNGYEFEVFEQDVLINGTYSNNSLNIYSDALKIEINKINNNEYKIYIKYSINDSYMVLENNIKTNINDNKQNIALNTSINYGNNDNNISFNVDNDININKNGTIKPMTSFITKDLSTIDENEATDIEYRLDYIISSIVNDLYPKNKEGNNKESIVDIMKKGL